MKTFNISVIDKNTVRVFAESSMYKLHANFKNGKLDYFNLQLSPDSKDAPYYLARALKLHSSTECNLLYKYITSGFC